MGAGRLGLECLQANPWTAARVTRAIQVGEVDRRSSWSETMSNYRTLFGIALFLALPMQWGCAAEIENREQALQALKSPDAQARRAGAAALAKYGEMADADILLEELYDEDPQVREVAEQAVWQVWMRSGDARV